MVKGASLQPATDKKMIGLYGQRSITIDVSEPLLTPAESTKNQIVVGSLVGFDDLCDERNDE